MNEEGLAPDRPAIGNIRHIQRALTARRLASRAILRATREEDLLAEMCRIAVEQGGYRMAWVGYAEHDARKSIRVMAHAGMEAGFLAGIDASWDEANPHSRGASGTAIRTGRPHVVHHVATDPDFLPWRDEALRRGYAAVVGLPLTIEGQTMGAVVIHAPEANVFDDLELEMLTELAEDFSFGIMSLRARAQQKQADETIRRMAYYDSLTGLPNRASLKERLQEAIAEARRGNVAFPLLLLDIDRFREINDALGYVEGDRLLREMGPRLRHAAGEAAFVAYLGEDEYALLLSPGDAEMASLAAQRILRALAEPFELSGFRVDVRASIGIAMFPGHGSTPDALILRAEAAMHRAKGGSAGYLLDAGGPTREHTRRLALIGDLSRAIDASELMLYCQPKVDIRAGRVCGAEALVRWNHSRLGMISLAELIPLAEQTGLIKPLTHWVLGAALRQCHAWTEQGLRMPLAVNVSMRNLRETAFLDRVSGLLLTWGAHGLLQIEVTESALMEDPARTLEVLNRLHEMGIELSVDDFGTGYSSLGYLQKLPVDNIKIDQSFVRDMALNEDSTRIVHSTIDLAHDLELKVVAEGVETEDVWDRLASLGCDAAQGYYISKPIPADQLIGWHAASRWGGMTQH